MTKQQESIEGYRLPFVVPNLDSKMKSKLKGFFRHLFRESTSTESAQALKNMFGSSIVQIDSVQFQRYQRDGRQVEGNDRVRSPAMEKKGAPTRKCHFK